MFYFLLLYLLFLYFKLARVHKKEEGLNPLFLLSHSVMALCAVWLYWYGFTHYAWWSVLGASLLFFIVAALNITAIQLGIFKDGQPLLGITRLYRLMPILSVVVTLGITGMVLL